MSPSPLPIGASVRHRRQELGIGEILSSREGTECLEHHVYFAERQSAIWFLESELEIARSEAAMRSMTRPECPASLMRLRGKQRNQNFGDILTTCASLPSFASSRLRQNDLEDAVKRFSLCDFMVRPFHFDFYMGRTWNPFVGLEGEAPWRVVILVGPEKIDVVLRDATNLAVARTFAFIEDDWDLVELPRTLEMALDSPRFRVGLEPLLKGWLSLYLSSESVRETANALKEALQCDRDECAPTVSDRFGFWWFEAITRHRVLPSQWLAAIGHVGSEPATPMALKFLHAISCSGPYLLRIALEWALLAARDLTRMTARVPTDALVGRLSINAEAIGLLRERLCAVERRGPSPMRKPLRDLVARLLSVSDGCVLEVPEAQVVRRTSALSVLQDYETASFEEELAGITRRYGWSIKDRDGVLEAIVTAEKEEAPFPTLRLFSTLAEEDEANPDELIVVLKLREYCAREVTEGSAPPSYRTLLCFIREEMHGVPDPEDARELLLELIDTFQVEPYLLASVLKERYERPGSVR